MHHYDEAKKAVAACLGPDWQLAESPRKIGEGTKAQFSRGGQSTVVGVQAVATEGLFPPNGRRISSWVIRTTRCDRGAGTALVTDRPAAS